MDANYVVAVVGGACAGSEIASRLADHGMEVVVFEQNDLPYGKVEDGLPRWHEKMRVKESGLIDQKLDRDGVHFVPRCQLGKDISTEDLIHRWSFDMVILANGAWRDRELDISGAAEVTDDSLIYQNAFVYWFNHYQEKNFNGKRFVVPPGAAVIGGGLASLDVVKIFQFETVANALAQRGLSCDLLEMEHKGIHSVLAAHGLTWESLGLAAGKLFYRKRVCDMPLIPLGDVPSPAKLAKAPQVREKVIANAVRKYAFEVYPLHSPVEVHHQAGSLSAVSFAVMEEKDGRFVKSGKVSRVEVPLVVSSIGSLPLAIPGVPMDGDLYQWDDRFTGQVTGMPRFYCVGNAITGRGNIIDSLKNARRLAEVVGHGLRGDEVDYSRLFRNQEEAAREHVSRLLSFLQKLPRAMESDLVRIRKRVAEKYEQLGYANYQTWRAQILDGR